MKEIDELSIEELRLEIAKAKGWTPPGNLPWRWRLGKKLVDSTPDWWPLDIADAWELVEEMGSEDWSMTIEKLPNRPQEIICRVFQPMVSGHSILAFADTAPLAISRLWLKWQRAKGE